MKQYKYELKWWIIITCLLMFGVATVLFYNLATTNDAGIIFNGVVELSPSSATIFYYIMFGFCASFVGGVLFSIYSRLQGPVYILIDNEKISIPPVGVFQKETVHILFNEIESIWEQTINRNVMLNITYQGKRSVIHKNMLQKSDYLEIRDLLASKISNN